MISPYFTRNLKHLIPYSMEIKFLTDIELFTSSMVPEIIPFEIFGYWKPT